MRNSKKTLTDDDRILWGKVARSTRPMPGRMKAIEEFEAQLEARDGENTAQKAAPTKTVAITEVPAEPPKKPSGRHQPLERPVKRKLANEFTRRNAYEKYLALCGLGPR